MKREKVKRNTLPFFNKKTSLGRVEYYLVLCVISG